MTADLGERPVGTGDPKAFCYYSFLIEDQCAHCHGHYLDPDLEELTKV